MIRVLVAITMFCLLWQSMSYAGARVVLAPESAETHERMHFEKIEHHHLAHGDLQEDDSPESIKHALQDCSTLPTALAASLVTAVEAHFCAPLVASVPSIGRSAALRRLDRPPQTAA